MGFYFFLFLFMLQFEGEIIEVVSVISVLQEVRGMNDQRDLFWVDNPCMNNFPGKPTSGEMQGSGCNRCLLR